MQYLCLIYSAENAGPQYGSPEFGAFIQEYNDFTTQVNEDKVFVAGDALEPVATATCVTRENGKVETMDGPFAETKEQLGGYYLLDCKDLDEALKYAAMIPSAKYGRIEVRPIKVYS